MIEINHSIRSRVITCMKETPFQIYKLGAMVHRRLVYIYLLNVPSFSSRYFNKIKRTSRLGRLLALSLEVLYSESPSRHTLLTKHRFNVDQVLTRFHKLDKPNFYQMKISIAVFKKGQCMK